MKKESNWKEIYATNLRLGLSKMLRGIGISNNTEFFVDYVRVEQNGP